MQDTSSVFYRKQKIPTYGSEVYRDVGQAFLISVLDLHCINPLSRLVKGPTDDPVEALAKIRKDLKREYQKPSIKSLKKKGAKTKRGKTHDGPSFVLVLGGDEPQSESAKSQEP